MKKLRMAKAIVILLCSSILVGLAPTPAPAFWGWDPTTNVVPALLHPKFINPLPAPPRIDATKPGTNLVMEMRQSAQDLGFRDYFGRPIQTNVWGYNQQGSRAQHLGPTIVVKQGVPVNVTWRNQLPDRHLFNLPTHGHRARPADGRVPAVVHLHGGHTEPESDGHPEAWYTRDNNSVGEHYTKETYTYSNNQNASTLWYHDHALGITRLNVNAGLAGAYLVRDDKEASFNLPSGRYERELIIQDLQLDEKGQLARNLEFPVFFGDFITVNGKAWPYMNVEPRKYRFRVLNGSEARFYELKLANGLPITQIGTEGGFIENPQNLDVLKIAPGERYDIVVDFSGRQGQRIRVNNLVDTVPGLPNLNPATNQIMEFRVGWRTTEADAALPTTLAPTFRVPGKATTFRRLLVAQALDLSPHASPSMPIIDLHGTLEGGMMRWSDPVTETPKVGEPEIWEFYNTSMVAHPIHVHQVDFKVLFKQSISTPDSPAFYYGDERDRRSINPVRIGSPRKPEIWERGEKDTIVVPPHSMVRIKLRFDIAGDYVWHCHILTHEDHDMMRPISVRPA